MTDTYPNARTIAVVADCHIHPPRIAFPEAALEAMSGADLIVTLGDMGETSGLDQLAAIAPVVGVLGGDDQPIPVTERPWYRELLEGDDPVALVRAAARQSRLTKERAGDLMVIIRQAAATEPVLAELWEKIETEFREVLGGCAGRLDELGALAVDRVRATDLLWTLNHPDTWYLLVRRCGWTADQYEQWVGDTLAAQLLAS